MLSPCMYWCYPPLYWTTSTVLKLSPLYWATSTVLKLSPTVLKLSPTVLKLSSDSTDVIPWQYWCYPPMHWTTFNVLNNLHSTEPTLHGVGNTCILIESVHRLPRENTNSALKPWNSSICFLTYTRWSNDYSKLVRVIKLCCSLLSAKYWRDRLKAEVNKMNKDTLTFKNTLWLLWLKAVLLCLFRIIHSTHPPPPPPSLYRVQKYLSHFQITLILLISHMSSWSCQAVQIIEYSRKAQTQSQEEVIQSVELILQDRISIGLCNWGRFSLI